MAKRKAPVSACRSAKKLWTIITAKSAPAANLAAARSFPSACRSGGKRAPRLKPSFDRAEDLAAITTMGFRGEALPSIASVSRFTLTTRERDGDSPEGTQVIVHGGKILEVKSAGLAPGTSVEVRQLFYNLPARRKFLRSEETERAHIEHYLTLAALAFPAVGFTFLQDQRPVWQLPPLRDDGQPASQLAALQERLRVLLGAEVKLLPVDFAADLHESAKPDELREAPSPRVARRSTLR